MGLAQAGVGGTLPLFLLWDPLPLTLKSPLHQSFLFYTPAPGTPGLGRPSAGQHLPGTGWGNRWWRCPPWHQHAVPGAGRGGRDSWTTAPMALVHSPRKGGMGRVRRGVGGRAGGSFCGSVCGKVFFFLSPPFSLSKKCTKARQPLCNDQQCFLRVGLAGRGPRAWQPSLRLKGGLILLRNVSQFKYQTKNRAWRTTLTVAKSLPERTASINKKIEIFTSR